MVERPGPAIVISASGMATGGRVLHHLANGLPDARNTVLFVGFQAAGTRGRQLIEGAQEVQIFGQFVPVHAPDREAERDVSARRCERNRAVAAHVPGAAADRPTSSTASRRRKRP